jgi:hypothetical protein
MTLMRKFLFLLPLLCSTPALAQQQPPAAQAPQEVQRALSDPATIDRMANTMQALSKAFLQLPVGEVQAAMEGRKPTQAEKRMTVRDLGRRDDKQFDRHVQEQIAGARPMIEQSMKAMAAALPAMMKSMEEAGNAMERAVANMPDPTYPKR